MKAIIPVCILLFTAMPTMITAQTEESISDQQAIESRFAALKEKGTDLHISVYPVVLNGQSGAHLSPGAALLLETAGVKKIDTVAPEARFVPESEDIDEIAAAFQQFTAAHPFPGEYAYFMQIEGTPQRGGEKFWSVIVDREGHVVFADYHTITFIKPKTVLGCVHECVKTFCSKAGLGDPGRKDGPQGEWHEYFKNRQGRQ